MFEVLYHPDVPVEDLPSLNRDIKARLRRAIEARLTRAPEDYGKPLVGNLKGYWSLRVGDCRIVYIIEATKVKIIQISDRRDAYREGILDARRRGWLT
ncbi:MAG: type II toxin-antitoxin system RelE/ParE family toxin [Elusimicrobia bacterium]|nr:type II toxin-antitoxin system RelE/ParE family toxin [Elusimicrobiota bacterium]